MEAQCDECARVFTIVVIERPTVGFYGGDNRNGVMQEFGCPYCGHVYKIAFITTSGLELRDTLQLLKAEAQTARRDRRIERLLEALRGEVYQTI